MTQGSADRELRAAVEHFLFEEAELLDSWRLNEWVELFTEDAISHVPALDEYGSRAERTELSRSAHHIFDRGYLYPR